MTSSTPAKDQTMALNVPNLDRLISHLEVLPADKFNMQLFYSGDGDACSATLRGKVAHTCGTAACIAGWIFELDADVSVDGDAASRWLGLTQDQGDALFEPTNYSISTKYPLSRALRMLRHLRAEYLRTGSVVVDWDAPEAVEAPRKFWAPPVVIGADKPLPDELTRWVRDPVAPTPIPQGERHGC